MTVNVHRTAAAGFASGTNELYDRARPSYPAEALTELHAAVAHTTEPIKVLELASGTGLFTRALLSHPSWESSLGELRAVEPSAGMREVFQKTISDPRVSVKEGSFAKIGEQDGWADLVVVAQAWHWCDPDYDQGIAEIARVLKPNGTVAFIWNLEDSEAAPWVAGVRELIQAHEDGSPQYRLGKWRATFTTPSYEAFFLPPKEHVWTRNIATTLPGVQDRALSKSYIAILPDSEKERIKQEIVRIVEKGPRSWINENEGTFEYPYQTTLILSKHK